MIRKNKIAERILDKEKTNLLWTKKYAPTEKKDIPLYKMSQVEKFENLLNNCFNRNMHSPKVIVITGPVGCGKTTLVNVICNEKKIEIIKFSPEEDYLSPDYFMKDDKYLSLTLDKKSLNGADPLLQDFQKPKNFNKGSSFIAKLNLFLERCQAVAFNKYSNNRQLLLIDDITLSQSDRHEFLNAIYQYNANPNRHVPLIWIADPNDTQKKISGCYYFPFPAASRSVLKRVLKRVSQLRKLNLTENQLNSFIDENPGDVRLAVNMLQFAQDCSTGKYDYLSYFQAIGEILYQKNRLSSEDILKISQCSPKMMIKGLYENSLDFFADVSEYADCAEYFSLSDTFMGMEFFVPELGEVAAVTAMRGLLTSLQTRQENRFFCMRHGSKSHLRNITKSDLYHQELLIEDLLTQEDRSSFGEYFPNPPNRETFVCWPNECKDMNSVQMDSRLFDESLENVYIRQRNQMEIERENQIKEQELSEAMSLLSIDPIDSSVDDFFEK